MKNLFVQLVIALLLTSMMLMSVGCYGSFGLTSKVYKWNDTMEGKWVKELVFLVMNIVPVYSVAVGVDAIVLNSIEFWTGSNPISSTTATKDGASVAFNVEKKAVTISYGTTFLTLTQENGKTVAKDNQGNVVAYAVPGENSSINIVDKDGKILRTYSRTQVDAIAINK
ncbi:MAG TPA: DUF3332 family protein [Bacteroidota bacterium]|nr:DUF3332 family protein [Bacteroidota bacterium]